MSDVGTPPINKRTELPPEQVKTLSPSQLDAYNYLHEKRIFEFFQFLICHLLAEQPEDPVTFLGNLLDRCMMFRSGIGEPPLLFTEKHVQAMYRALDPRGDGFITRQQYENGLKTMNIVGFNIYPKMEKDGYVNKSVFINEAIDCLTRSLSAMLRAGDVVSSQTDWKIPVVDMPPPEDWPARPASDEEPSASPPPLVSTRPGYARPRLCNVPDFRLASPSELTSYVARVQSRGPGAVVPPPPADAGPAPERRSASPRYPEVLQRRLPESSRASGRVPQVTEFATPEPPPPQPGDVGAPQGVIADYVPCSESKAFWSSAFRAM